MELLDYEREHLAVLRDSLAECTVLLKSDGSFPIETAGELALYGSGARQTVKGGTGSGEVNSRFFINVEDGLEQAGFRLTTTHMTTCACRRERRSLPRSKRRPKSTTPMPSSKEWAL